MDYEPLELIDRICEGHDAQPRLMLAALLDALWPGWMHDDGSRSRVLAAVIREIDDQDCVLCDECMFAGGDEDAWFNDDRSLAEACNAHYALAAILKEWKKQADAMCTKPLRLTP